MGLHENQVIAMKHISACPKCRKAAGEKDFTMPFLDTLYHPIPVLHCMCGYSGFPVSMPQKEYLGWAKGSVKPKKR